VYIGLYVASYTQHEDASHNSRFCSIDTAAHSDYFVLMRLLNTLTHSLTHSLMLLSDLTKLAVLAGADVDRFC